MNDFDTACLRRAIDLSRAHSQNNAGGPFGAVIARNGQILGEGWNQVTSTNDPTAHAEVVAIRNACRDLGTFSLAGATVYTSCEPCPMCLAAIYWARVDRIVYANGREDAASIGFDDAFLYTEIALALDQRSIPMQRLLAEDARAVFDEWAARPDRVPY